MGAARVSSAAMKDWEGWIPRAGLDPRTLESWQHLSSSARDGMVQLARFVKALQRIDRENSNPGLAWIVGLACDYHNRGAVGRAVCGSGTLGASLQRLAKYYPLVQDATSLSLEINEQTAAISYRILDPDIWPRSADALYTLGVLASFVRSVAPADWGEVTLHVEADARAFRGSLSDIVETRAVFNSQSNALHFPVRMLERAVNASDYVNEQWLATLSRHLSRKLRQTPISDRARHVIFRALARGHVDQEQIARELAVSSRTLRRKLAGENVSFQDLLDECRMRAAALEFRISPGQSLSGMALKLGYSEHSSFSRAFSRWSGMPPHVFRNTFARDGLY